MDTESNPNIIKVIDLVDTKPELYGPYIILGSALCFAFASRRLTAEPKEFKDKKGIFSFHDWQKKNLLLSWTHALIASILTVIELYYHGEEYILHPVESLHYNNERLHFMLNCTLGYFLYDTVDTLRFAPNQIEILVHHAMITWIMIYNLYYCVFLPGSAIVLTAEISGVLLHGRKLLQLYKWDFAHPLYRTTAILNLIAFLPFRFGTAAATFYMLKSTHAHLSTFHSTLMGTSTIIVSVMYVVLFIRLIKNDILRGLKGSKKRTSKMPNGVDHQNNYLW